MVQPSILGSRFAALNFFQIHIFSQSKLIAIVWPFGNQHNALQLFPKL